MKNNENEKPKAKLMDLMLDIVEKDNGLNINDILKLDEVEKQKDKNEFDEVVNKFETYINTLIERLQRAKEL